MLAGANRHLLGWIPMRKISCMMRCCCFSESRRSIFNQYYLTNPVVIDHKTTDSVRARRSLFNIDDQYKDLPLSGDDQIRWAELSEEDYARFREVSCNLRSDDFLIPLPNGMYVRPTQGWVSGWVHSYSIKNRRYTYWLYSAFVGSRSKGEHPRRLKTSSSRHEAYMALMEYNKP